MTKQFSKTAKPRREPTVELVEWTAACQEYCDARLAGQLTEAHRAKARETWLAVKDRMEPSPFTLELMDELLGMEMMTHDPASAKERQH